MKCHKRTYATGIVLAAICILIGIGVAQVVATRQRADEPFTSARFSFECTITDIDIQDDTGRMTCEDIPAQYNIDRQVTINVNEHELLRQLSHITVGSTVTCDVEYRIPRTTADVDQLSRNRTPYAYLRDHSEYDRYLTLFELTAWVS